MNLVVRVLALAAAISGCSHFPATYKSQPPGVRSVTTYRTAISGEPYGVVPIGDAAFYYQHANTASSEGVGVEAGTVSAEGSLREYLIQTKSEFESVSIAADGTLWSSSILDSAAWPPAWHGAIERLKTNRSEIAFRIPRHLGYAKKLVRGPDGAWWFALPDAHAVGRLTRNGTFSTTILSKSLEPDDIAFDSNGTLYAATSIRGSLYADGSVARVLPGASHVVFHTLSRDASVGSLAGSNDGVWFTEPDHRIGHITQAGHVEEFSVGSNIRVLDAIAVGKDSVWFAAQDGVGRLSLQTHAISFIPLPDRGSQPNSLAVSQSGDIWLTESIHDPRCFAECGGIARIVP